MAQFVKHLPKKCEALSSNFKKMQIDMYTYIYFLALSTKQARSTGIPGAASIPSVPIMVSKYYSPQRGARAF
jgi:hypothetical protein